MARFKGIFKSDDFEDNQQTYGNAFKILAEANVFMKRHLNIAGQSIIVDGGQLLPESHFLDY